MSYNPYHVLYIVLYDYRIVGVVIISISSHVVRRVGQKKVYIVTRIFSSDELVLFRQISKVYIVNEGHKSYLCLEF